MHLPRRYRRGLFLVSVIISLHIHISENVTLLLALIWDEGQIYASTEWDEAMPSPDVSGSWVGIFITPMPAALCPCLRWCYRGFQLSSEKRDLPHRLQHGRWREKGFIYYERAGNIPKHSPLPAAAVGKGKHLKMMEFVACH